MNWLENGELMAAIGEFLELSMTAIGHAPA